MIYWKSFQEKKLKIVEDSEDKQIISTATGSKIESIDIEISEGPHKIIPPEYKQSSYHEKRMYLA